MRVAGTCAREPTRLGAGSSDPIARDAAVVANMTRAAPLSG